MIVNEMAMKLLIDVCQLEFHWNWDCCRVFPPNENSIKIDIHGICLFIQNEIHNGNIQKSKTTGEFSPLEMGGLSMCFLQQKN